MAFSNPIVGGTTLIREAIHSPNYVAGVSGWTINKDGTAEFADATIRGDLDVKDPGGLSEVLVDVQGGIGAAISIYPPGGPAAYPQPAQLFADAGLTSSGALDITSPSTNLAYNQADVLLCTSNPGLSLGAQIYLQAPGDGVYASDHLYVVSPAGVAGKVYPTGTGVAGLAVSSGSDTTTSATYVDMGGTGSTTSFSFTKAFDETRIQVTAMVGMWCATATAQVDVAVHIGGTDYQLGHYSFDAASARRSLAFQGYIPAGAGTAGTYTLQARWKRSTGTGTLTRDVLDWFAFSAQECT